MRSSDPRNIETLASDLGVSVPEVLEAAKHFTTKPGALLDGEVPDTVASRLTAYFNDEK
ncbi:hypothetical protein [Streptomyces longwoodensis]|uniref:hypothetical protein n=1 Tax=Streptomyces longwoodensis TaxID=68231 RepID=UPI00225546E9|nr:hypothetical protein [Streptomyces longwoodensis]MCX5000969.1 hypothetical protein [Streptomyces longwoodensis]